MTNILKAILAIDPNAKCSVSNNDINSIQWTSTPISVADIQAQFTAVEFDTAMEDLRTKRNKLLIETDWMANSDVTMSETIITYRQDLRDITNGLTTVEDVNAVTWPTKPGA